MSKWWEAVNKFRRKRIRKEMGEKIDGDRWVKHFEELLNNKEAKNIKEIEEEEEGEETVDGRDEDDISAEFSKREFETAIKKLGSNKAPGEDGIAAEFIKNLTREVSEELRIIINKMWDESKVQPRWEKARIITIHKTGDENTTENYRGISLLNIGYKLLTCMMAERIMSRTDREGKMKESQAGFRKRRGTR